MPIFDSFDEKNLPRNTDQETFDYAEGLFREALNKIPVKKEGQNGEGNITKGTVAAFLAELYFNAEATTGVAHFEECAQLCQGILDNKYGNYGLDAEWYGPHSFDNNTSPAIIWSTPSELNYLEYRWFFSDFCHYNISQFFDIDGGSNNGGHLTPFKRPDGTLYGTTMKLGSPFEKFDDGDLRKKVYNYLGGKYEGMFIFGSFLTPGSIPSSVLKNIPISLWYL